MTLIEHHGMGKDGAKASGLLLAALESDTGA